MTFLEVRLPPKTQLGLMAPKLISRAGSPQRPDSQSDLHCGLGAAGAEWLREGWRARGEGKPWSWRPPSQCCGHERCCRILSCSSRSVSELVLAAGPGKAASSSSAFSPLPAAQPGLGLEGGRLLRNRLQPVPKAPQHMAPGQEPSPTTLPWTSCILTRLPEPALGPRPTFWWDLVYVGPCTSEVLGSVTQWLRSQMPRPGGQVQIPIPVGLRLPWCPHL